MTLASGPNVCGITESRNTHQAPKPFGFSA